MRKIVSIFTLVAVLVFSLQITFANEQRQVALADKEKAEALLTSYNIPLEVKTKILEYQKKDSKGTIILTIPKVSLLKSTYTNTYSYNGTPMKDICFFYYDANTGWVNVETGSATKTVASGLSTITLTAAGFISTPVALVAGGISLFQAWVNFVNINNVSGTSGDKLSLKWRYNVTTKYTYADIGNGWQLGLVSEAVLLKEIDSNQVYQT